MSDSLDSLVERIRAGDKKAEHSLVERYWRSLYFIINHRAKDPDLAADIAQDAFVVVINKARNGEIENPAALSSFIRQVGINLLISSYRKEQRRKTDCEESIATTIADQQAEIATSLNSQQLAVIVKQVMDELPTPRDSDMLYRYFVYGQEKLVICAEFDISTEHFDRVLYRARNRLKQVMQVKLGIDLQKVSLNHLLSIGLIIGLSIGSEKIIHDHMRDFARAFHLKENAVKDRPSSTLEELQCQQLTRLT
ncbi:RNA polymerase sigma factor [Aliiglaciecola sp. M165]|uniref:RNA polymerase sigma factor n=1 Tax=Aliiglaciecola sp. M165 TaxID=2593649 RepID=UPI00163DE3E4|nr:sigma-70 family RNA polymerase sigma factor [Aliiglaciecola sp. M165]